MERGAIRVSGTHHSSPGLRFASSGLRLCYLDIHEDDQPDEAQLAAWVKQASQLLGVRGVSGRQVIGP